MNFNIFDNIDNEEKAYWLGFIYADGTIRSQENRTKPFYQFELSLSIVDISHLEKFKKFINLENEIKVDDQRCRIVFNNKHLWNALNDLGCIPNKSQYDIDFPEIPNSLIRHFMRGYFDGDGCISRKINKNSVAILTNVIGSESFLNTFEKYLSFSKPVTRTIDKRWTSEFTRQLVFKQDESMYLIKFLYDNSNIYLDRKYKLYEFFKEIPCRSLKEFNELLVGNIGEVWDDNTEINSEITQGSESL